MSANVTTGIVKQVISGDSIKIRDKPKNGPPKEKTIILANVTAPKIGNRKKDDTMKEEPYAWESREYLRKKLIGQEVYFTVQPSASENPSDRKYGNVFFPKDNSITEELVENGLVTVRSENIRQPSLELQKLIELEKKAKAEGKGKWATKPKTTGRNVTFITDKGDTTLKNIKNKRVDAVIEGVVTGSTVQALLLPDFYHITLLISGVRCDSPNNDIDGFGLEAKFFVECRLLQQDVQVIVEAFRGNNVVGSIVHPKGDIAELLLKEGFASCVDSTMINVTNGSDKLRAAERYAKENHLRRWANWEPTDLKIPNKEFQGMVNEIISGDGLIIKLPSGESKRIFLASIRPPRMDSTKKENEDPNETKTPYAPRGRIFDIPWLFEAREFLRKKLIGKKVNVVVDYIQPGRDNYSERLCCTVSIGGMNIAESLVSQGLATVVPHRQDDESRSSYYDALLLAQQKALENQRGIHSKEKPKHRINDITGNPTKAKGMIPILQRATKLDAIVEYVAGGARMRMFVPRDSVVITFLLSGVNCPKAEVGLRTGGRQPADPYGDEALKFTKDKVIQRDVEIKIETSDRAGNMIGWLFINGVNLSIALVEEGLAFVHTPSAERSEYYRQLMQAEEVAKANKLNIWQNAVEETKEKLPDESSIRGEDYKNVRIEVITPDLHVFAQHIEDEGELMSLTHELRHEMSSYTSAIDYRPKKGEMCAAKFSDNEWYRGKVQKFMGPKAQVLYVDYGNSEEVPLSDLAPLPFGLNMNKPFAHEYALACVKAPPKEYTEDALLGFHKQISGRVLSVNIEYYEQNVPYISIVDPETKEDEIKKAVTLGYFLVANRREKKLQSLLEAYNAAQTEAKKKHLLIWEYGDITEDDAKEFGFGK